MILQLKFDNPAFVSQEISGLDKLEIRVKKSSRFISKTTFGSIPEDSSIKNELPKQYSEENKAQIEALESTADAIKTGTTIFASSNLVF